jgi:cysteinyl-tRNA synthetase
MTADPKALRPVRIYDSMTRKKQLLEPLEPGKVKMYVCGVTVYDLTHIGHARTYITFDVVQRFLRRIGYDVTYVRNFTDVDDKIIKRAAELGEHALALSQRFIDAFHEDMGRLGIGPADVEPKVSTHIDEIVAMTQRLVDKGYAYAVDGDVYYRVSKFKDYGKLSGRKLEDMEAGRSGRVEDEEQVRKEHPFDFALWKSARPGEIAWESPWGPGRPGWHIECSAMSCKHLGASFDIHGGGSDLAFPHHENEIAQSEAANGAPFATLWMHSGMLNIDGEKMSKSLGNFWTTRDALAAYHPEVLRLLMFSAHYRNLVNYSLEGLSEATRRAIYLYDALWRIDEALARGGVQPGDTPAGAGLPEHEALVKGFVGRFEEALADDFNVPMAMTHVLELARAANELTASKKKPRPEALVTLAALRAHMLDAGDTLHILKMAPAEALVTLRDMCARSMGLDTAWVEERVAARQQARADKDWAAADAIRDELLGRRVEIMDGADGTTWRIRVEAPEE